MNKPALMLSVSLLAGLTSAATAQTGPDDRTPVIVVDGHEFYSWQAYTSSDLFKAKGLHCAFDVAELAQRSTGLLGSPSDCSYNNTNIKAEYGPNFIIEIPVVVHVIKHTNGQGNVSNAKVQTQIDILNEDFRAIAGTNGSPGFDCLIQFKLATEDPNGNPTNGITVSTNNTWFNDGGSYWNSLAWDTNRYMNIYTNSAQGYLGYVPDLPQGGIAGSNADRVVCLWSAFGRNGPIGPPYNQGRTATHEVGHYLGLYHTFNNGCGTSSCYTTGDRICDTNREANPRFGCPGSASSCSSSDPYHNYMDYSDDLCMWEFTEEQSNRMRCSLEHYRPLLGEVLSCNTNYGSGCGGTNNFRPELNIGGCWEGGASVSIDITRGLGGVPVFVFYGTAQSNINLGGGCTLLTFPWAAGSPLGPWILNGVGPGNGFYTFNSTLPVGTPSGTVYMQAFTLDNGGAKNYAVSNGTEVIIQ